jgi:arylsulfatase A-like enzyme
VRFTQAITGGSWTQAAFPVILTSTYASMYGGCIGPLAEERPSAIEALSRSGYTTAGFVTSPMLGQAYNYQRGFDHFAELTPGEKDPGLRKIRGGQFFLRLPITHRVSQLIGVRSRPAKLYISAEELTDQICQWIGETHSPFFIWGHYMDVHWPYHLEDQLKRPKDIAQAWSDVAHLHAANWNGAPISDQQRDHYIQLYEQAVVYTDKHLGRLFDYLVENGLAENTVVILLADHGEEFLEHGRWGHWEDNLYDEVLRVPLIIKMPGHTTGQVIDRQVRLLDLMPTVFDLCDSPLQKGMRGNSMAPLWTGDGRSYSAEVTVSEMWHDAWHIVSVRTEAYKYIWDNKKPEQSRLYDLQVDPGELHNLSASLPEIRRELHEHVEARIAEMTQSMPELAINKPELDEDMLRRLRDLGYIE